MIRILLSAIALVAAIAVPVASAAGSDSTPLAGNSMCC